MMALMYSLLTTVTRLKRCMTKESWFYFQEEKAIFQYSKMSRSATGTTHTPN
jgi:hypothetical protein